MKLSQSETVPTNKYFFSHSNHSQIRASERGITDNDIQIALDYSESIFKQGLVFHVVMNKMIPNNLPKRQLSRIKNLVVVTANDEPKIITCYRSDKALAKIRRKSKRLQIDAHTPMSNIA